MVGLKAPQHDTRWTVDLGRLLLLWLLSAIAVIVWIRLDQTPPAWDQGDHLSRALDHWRVLRQFQGFSSSWWRELWTQAPTQRGPVTYLLTVPFFALLGPGFDQGVAVNLLFTAILLASIYVAGRRLFSATTGLWAAGLMLLSPVLLDLQNNYLLDFPMTAMTALMFAGMTVFWFAERPLTRWLALPLFGVTTALALMTRTSGLLFVVFPVLWMLGRTLWQRQWVQLGQVCLGLLIGLGTLWPWFSTNWLTIVSTTLASNSHGTRYRGDPQASSLAGWLFYPERLPHLLSWPLFALSLSALIILILNSVLFRSKLPLQVDDAPPSHRKAWVWIAVFCGGAYLLFSLGSYKALRVFIPCIPVVWIALAQLVTRIQNRWWRGWRWGSVGVATVFALMQLFGNYSYLEETHQRSSVSWPNQAVIDEVIQTSPFLKANVGMAAHTAQFNAFTMDFYGSAADFHVFTRELAGNPDSVPEDIEALDWYLTQTGDQGLPENFAEGPQKLLEAIVADDDLSLHQSWSLPDNTEVRLYHRDAPPIEVKKVAATSSNERLSSADSTGAESSDTGLSHTKQPPVSLTVSQVPDTVVPDKLSAITYTVRGTGAALEPGLLLLTWVPDQAESSQSWVSDHAIGLGYLNTTAFGPEQFQVTEHLSLRPPADARPGTYHLKAEYLNRQTQSVELLGDRLAQVEVTAAAGTGADPSSSTDKPAPFQDLLTYFNTALAPNLATGDLDPIFYHVGRINQYDPQQDYLLQAEQAMTYRLTQTSDRIDWLYSLALSHVLQQKGPQATQALEALTAIAPDNPNHWAYLGFVHLYRWQPGRAEPALTQAEQLQPDLPNLKLLQTVNAAMGLNVPKALRLARSGL